jgi:hypothetical protein
MKVLLVYPQNPDTFWRGRHNYWKFFWSTLIRRPRQLRYAIELAVIGYHFRRIASRL